MKGWLVSNHQSNSQALPVSHSERLYYFEGNGELAFGDNCSVGVVIEAEFCIFDGALLDD